MSENVPAMQGVGFVLPAAQNRPSGHDVHSDPEVRLVASEKLPAGHTCAADAPSGQKLPATHGLHPVAPSASWNVPPKHLVQV